MYKTIIFDFDGTLADTFALTIESLNSAFAHYGYHPMSADYFRSTTFSEIARYWHISLFRAMRIQSLVRKELHAILPDIAPIQGMADIVRELKRRKANLAILSSNDAPRIRTFLHNNDLEIFDPISSSISIFGKEQALIRFCHKHHLPLGSVIYVGDMSLDVIACKKAKIPIVSVCWGFNSQAVLREEDPDFIVEAPDELIQIFEKLGFIE